MGPMDWAGLVKNAFSPNIVDDMEWGRLLMSMSWSAMSDSGRANSENAPIGIARLKIINSATRTDCSGDTILYMAVDTTIFATSVPLNGGYYHTILILPTYMMTRYDPCFVTSGATEITKTCGKRKDADTMMVRATFGHASAPSKLRS